MTANTSAMPAMTWPGPRIAASLSSLSTPFWMERTPVARPTTGRIASAAASVSKDLTQKSTRSAGGCPSRRSRAAVRTVHSPSVTERTVSPRSSNGAEVRAPRHERHVLPRPRELGPEEAAGAARAHDHDAHQSHPERLNLQVEARRTPVTITPMMTG